MKRQMLLTQSLLHAAAIAALWGATLGFATEPGGLPAPTATDPLPRSPWMTGLADSMRSEWIPLKPGIEFATPGPQAAGKQPIVVLVPGLLAREHSMISLQSAIQRQEMASGVFRYSSHQGVRSAATLLAQQLRMLKASNPDDKVILVTHSMGGLVARCCLEDPATNPGNVTRLIMIAPPNHGSAVAGLSAAELAKQFPLLNSVTVDGCQSVDSAVCSFVGTAKDELKINSVLLQELAARPRAAGVRYSIIAGSGGPVSATWVDASFLVSDLFLSDQPDVKAALDSAREIASLDEWTKGRGDGVVSVESAKLSGVSDFVTLPFGHNDFGLQTTEATDQVVAEVIKRLSQ